MTGDRSSNANGGLASRDAFERYWREYGGLLHRHPRNSNLYDSHGTAMAWAAWQRTFPANTHETPACAVVTAAEALLEVLPVPNDYYGDEAQALREALDANTQKAVDVQLWICPNCKSENRDDYHRISCPGCGILRPPPQGKFEGQS